MGGGHGHGHGHSATADKRYLTGALALILGFMAVEVVTGIIAYSLALISDAAHMLTDAGAIALALVADAARRPARRGAASPSAEARRDPVRAGQRRHARCCSRCIVYEGVRRLVDPPDVDGGVVRRGRMAGIAVNLAATWLLAGPTAAASTSRVPSSTSSPTCSPSSPPRSPGAVVWLTGLARRTPSPRWWWPR